jgi:hypothetical protein
MFLLHIQVLLQNINFLWNPYLTIDFWESYQKFWVTISYPCIDAIAAISNSLFIFLLVVLSGLALIVILVTLHIFLLSYEINTPVLFLKLEKFLVFLICDAFFISCTTILVLLFKYSTFSESFVEEYSNNPSSSSLQLGIAGQIISLVSLGLILSITLVGECCKYEIRHFFTDKDLQAQSFSNIEVYIKLVYFITTIFSCTIQFKFYFYYLISIAFAYGFILYVFVHRLSYYSNFMNFLKIWLHFEILSICLFFIVGYILNNSTVITVLTIFMQPFIFATSKIILERRITKIKTLKDEIKSDFVIFELSARKRLLSSENFKQLFKYINLNYSNTKNEILFLIQAYYCNDVLKNSALGSIKLSRISLEPLNLFFNFQVNKCYKILEEINIKKSEGFKLFFYLISFDKISSQEKNLCKSLLGFWNKIFDKKCEFDSLNRFLSQSVYLMKDVKAKYLEILSKHPLSQQINEMFGTILIEILGECDLGQTHLEISQSNIKKTNNEKKKELFSDKDNLIMIVSGNEEDLGKVIYMSLCICEVLGVSPEDSKDYSLNDFIPKPYNENHNKNLYQYIENGLSEYAFSKIELCLKDKEGFLFECIVSVECVGYNLKSFFVIVAEPLIRWNRETALISDKGLIYGHTKKFPQCIGQNRYKVEQTYLSDFFPTDILDACQPEKFVFSRVYSANLQNYVKVCLCMADYKINSTTLYFFYVIHDPIELMILKKIKKKSECIEINRIDGSLIIKNYDIMTEKLYNSPNNFNSIYSYSEEAKMIESEIVISKENEGTQRLLHDDKNPGRTFTSGQSKIRKSVPALQQEHSISVYRDPKLKKSIAETMRSLKLLKILGFVSVSFI